VTATRLFAEIEDGAGYPDGPVVDTDGCLWVGLFAGWGVRRYDPAGKLIGTVPFPVANVTKIAFGGPDLRTAYATTATKGLNAAERAAQPWPGRCLPSIRGRRITGPSGQGLERDMGEGTMDETAGGAVNMRLIGAIVAVATIGGFMFGYDSGVINGTQKGLEAAFDLGKVGIGINVGAILVGSSIGAFGAGRLADSIGRRGVMKLAALLFLVSAILAGAAGSSALFIFARIIGGLGVGAASVISPVYISEVVPANVRGRLSSVQQVMIITGLTGAFVVNYILAHVAGNRPRSCGRGNRRGAGCSGFRHCRRRSISWRCSAFPKARAIWWPRAMKAVPMPCSPACSARRAPRAPLAKSAKAWRPIIIAPSCLT
jgi:hypothetical protein